MVVGVSAEAAVRRYGRVVVVGGGCYGRYYLRQLRRAREAGALDIERVVVVDREARCRVAAELEEARGEQLVVAAWSDYFAAYLGRAAADPVDVRRDAIVPSPLMPHLMGEWLVRRARERWPARAVQLRPLGREPAIPWQQRAPDGTHYVSFAEWTCPINCIEPPLCPVIRGPRSWSMPPALRAYVASERSRGRALVGPAVFHCEHRAYGVGMFDTAAVVAADQLLEREASRGAVELLVGTVSHCHGALNVIAIGD